jgi:hypothetical protein
MTRKIIIGLLIAYSTLTAAAIVYRKADVETASASSHKPIGKSNHLLILQSKATVMKKYLEHTDYNQQLCFFVDMSLPSGKKRFFVYDLEKGSILFSGLVAHGSGGKSTFEQPAYSNTVGSNCTSIGRYKIGQSYNGQFGLAYKLHGLDKTNSNAFNRFVVLHAHDCVPGDDISPDNICMSWGCPTVSPGFLQQLAAQINRSAKPVILEIYNGA